MTVCGGVASEEAGLPGRDFAAELSRVLARPHCVAYPVGSELIGSLLRGGAWTGGGWMGLEGSWVRAVRVSAPGFLQPCVFVAAGSMAEAGSRVCPARPQLPVVYRGVFPESLVAGRGPVRRQAGLRGARRLQTSGERGERRP